MVDKETWHNAGKYGSDTLVAGSNGVNIADVYGPATNPNSERHLALILAAPDLLAACKVFLEEWADCDGYDEAANAVILAKAAIAKAEGRP